MAETIERIIKIDVSGAVESLEDLKEEVTSSSTSFKSLKEVKSYIDELKASLMDLDETSEEYGDTLKEISDVEEKYNKILSDTSTTAKSAEGSYNALSKQMSELKKAFKATNDEAERKSLAKQITGINDKLKAMDASIGNYQRNVGNYQGAFTSGLQNIADKIKGMGNPLQAAKAGVKALGSAFKALIANPVGAVIMAIVGAVKLLKKGFEGSETATNKLKRAFANFEPIVNLVKNGLTKFANLVGDLAERAIPAMANAFEKAGALIMKGLNKLGIVSDETLKKYEDTVEAHKKAVKESQELSKREIDLIERRRKAEISASEKEIQISNLRAKASDKEKYSAEERKKYLLSALSLEKQISEENVAIAKEELAIAEARANQTDNTAEDNEKLVQLTVKLNNAQAQLNETIRSYNKELNGVNKEIQSLNDAEIKANEEAKKKAQELREKELKEIEEINNRIFLSNMSQRDQELYKLKEKYEKEKALYEKYEKDTTELTRQYEDERKKIRSNAIVGAYEEYAKNMDDALKYAEDIINVRFNNIYEREQAFLEQEKLNLEQKIEAIKDIAATQIGELTEDDSKKLAAELINLTSLLEDNGRQIKDHQIKWAQDTINTYSDMTNAIGQLMGEIAGFWQENIKARQKAGKINEAQAKKEFEDSKKLQIASAVVTGLAGIATAVATAMELGPILGPIMGAINGTIVAVSTALQIAKIKSTTYDGGGSSSSVQAPSVSSVQPTDIATAYTPSYTANLTGESETENLANAVGKQQMSQRVYVVESDIQEAGRRVDVREEEATF